MLSILAGGARIRGSLKIFKRGLRMNVRKIFLHAALILTSIAFLYLFSYSTSPRYFFIGNDSIIFQTVGKCWTEGVLPYVGTFENKGPLLFFVNAVGYLIYPRYGIMLLQIPFMYFSFLFMWRAVELYWSRRATLIIFLFMIFWRASNFYEGNRTEEYSMPFLMAATYFFLRGLKDFADGKFYCPPLVGAVYGVGFGACVLLRTTNGLPICCYVLLTAIFLLRAREFKTLRQNFLSFIAGFAAICLPFAVYFAMHGALYDMLYGTILLNINHATGFNPSAEEFRELVVPHVIYRCTMLIWMIPLSLLAVAFNRNSRLAWSGLITSAAMLFMLIKSRPFHGYLELIAPLLPIFFAVIYELKIRLTPALKEIWSIRSFSLKRILCKIGMLMLLLIIIFQTAIQGIGLYWLFRCANEDDYIKFHQKEQSDLHEFQKTIPDAERDSVICWGESNVIGQFILDSGIKPRCRFFGNIAMFFGKSDPAVIDEWIQNVRNDYPKWIVYTVLEEEYLGKKMSYFKYNFQRQRNPEVEKILDDRYALKAQMKLYDQIMGLYRLRE